MLVGVKRSENVAGVTHPLLQDRRGPDPRPRTGSSLWSRFLPESAHAQQPSGSVSRHG